MRKVNTARKYRTRSGMEIIGLRTVPKNSAGQLVTYPIKGTVIVRRKPFRTEYMIWDEFGKSQTVMEFETEYTKSMDLVEA